MHVRNSEVRTYDLLRKSVLRSFRMRKARLDVSRNRAKQEQIKSASGPPGRSPRGRRLGEKHPQPPAGALGSFLGVKAKPLRGRGKPRALDPIPPTVPLKPLRGPLARFSVKGGSRGWCGPQPRRGEGHGPLTRPERPKPAGRVSGALFPRHPCPSAKGPRQGRRKAL